MFVQSGKFVENNHKVANVELTCFGQEKTTATVRLGKMNLAVHGLTGDIREANTFYEDIHNCVDKFDFVQVTASNMYRMQYPNLFRNLVTVNCYERMHIDASMVPKMGDDGALYTNYIGEAYLAQTNESLDIVSFFPNLVVFEGKP